MYSICRYNSETERKYEVAINVQQNPMYLRLMVVEMVFSLLKEIPKYLNANTSSLCNE